MNDFLRKLKRWSVSCHMDFSRFYRFGWICHLDLSILYFASYGCHASMRQTVGLILNPKHLVVLIVGPDISHTSIQLMDLSKFSVFHWIVIL